MGLRQVDIPPWEVSFYEATEGSSHPMVCLQGYHPQGLLLPHLWWFIMLVRVWFRKEEEGRESIVSLQLQCTMTRFAHLCGHVGIQN